MNHISDDKIYLYAINSQKIKPEEKALIDEHFKECVHCSDFLSEAIDLIKTIETAKPIKITKEEFFNKIRNFNNTINNDKVSQSNEEKQNIILLHEKYFYEKNNSNLTRLAAMQKSEMQDSYKYVSTFASAQNFILMRVMYNGSLKRYQLFLLCEDMNKVKNAIVSFDGIRKYFAADENGIVELRSDLTNINHSVNVYIPVAKFEIKIKTIQGSKQIEQIKSFLQNDISLTAKIHGNKIDMKFNYDAHSSHKKLRAFIFPTSDYENCLSIEINKDKTCQFEFQQDLDETYIVVLVENSN